MVGESRSAFASFPMRFCRSDRERCIRHCTGSSNRDGSRRSGESRRTIVARSITHSLAMALNICGSSRRTGTVFRARLIWCWRQCSRADMRWRYTFPLRLRSLFRRQQAEKELDEEIQFHLQSLTDQYLAQGMTSQAARRAAIYELGHVEAVKEHCREARNVSFVENAVGDIRFGLRMLRRNPGFSALAILCLVLGIGSNAAVFSWIEGILLDPYPAVAHQGRLLMLAATRRGE